MSAYDSLIERLRVQASYDAKHYPPANPLFSEAAALIQSQAEKLEWRTIDSAPRDGTWVLLYGGGPDDRADHLEGHNVVSAFFDPDDGTLEVYAPDEAKDLWRFGDWDGGVYGAWCDPTHWLPLPSPPTEGS